MGRQGEEAEVVMDGIVDLETEPEKIPCQERREGSKNSEEHTWNIVKAIRPKIQSSRVSFCLLGRVSKGVEPRREKSTATFIQL